VSRLDFASSDEREHFLSFVQALLPPSVMVTDMVTGRQEGSGRAPHAPGSTELAQHPPSEGEAAVGRGAPSCIAGPRNLPPLAIARSRRGEGSAHASGEGALGEGYPPQQTVRSEVLTLLVGTWNMGDATAPPNLEGWLPRDAYDLYAVATQAPPPAPAPEPGPQPQPPGPQPQP